MSAYDITEFLRTAYRPFAYCVPCKSLLNTAYQKGGGVTLNNAFMETNPFGKWQFRLAAPMLWDPLQQPTLLCGSSGWRLLCAVHPGKACTKFLSIESKFRRPVLAIDQPQVVCYCLDSKRLYVTQPREAGTEANNLQLAQL